MFLLISMSIASAVELGVWKGDIMHDNNGSDYGTVDVSSTAQALSDTGIDQVLVEVEVNSGSADLTEFEEMIDALDASGATTSVLPVWNSPNNTGQTLGDWETDLSTLTAAIAAVGSVRVSGLTVHELHENLCYFDNSNDCWETTDIERITTTMNDAGLAHVAYIPADYRTLMHLDESILLAFLYTSHDLYDQVWAEATVMGPLHTTYSKAELTFTYATSGTASGVLKVEVEIDGTVYTPWTSDDLENKIPMVTTETIQLSPLLIWKSRTTSPKVRIVHEIHETGTNRVPVVVSDASIDARYVPAKSPRSPGGSFGVRTPGVSIPTTDFNVFGSDVSDVTTVLGETISYAVVTDAVDEVLSILPGSDALDDGGFAADPNMAAVAFTWMDNHLDSSMPRHAVVRAVDGNNWSASGWSVWEEGSFGDVLDALDDANVDSVVTYDAPLAIAGPDSGLFSEYYERDLGLFTGFVTPNTSKIHGQYHALTHASTPNEITRLFLWDKASTDEDYRLQVTANAGSGWVTLWDDQVAMDEGDSQNGCASGTVYPHDEVPDLHAYWYYCMQEVDLTPVGGSIAAGSEVRFETTVVGTVSNGTSSKSVFMPACDDGNGGDTRCVLTGYTFESGVEIPDFDPAYATYPTDIYDTLVAY
jgi:hypothetical protein